MVAPVGAFDVHQPHTRTESPAAAGATHRVIVGGRAARESVHEAYDVPAPQPGVEATTTGGDA